MTTTLKNGKLWIGGYDLSGDLNEIALSLSKDAPQDTRFGMNSRSYLPDGLRAMSLSMGGLFDADGTDEPDDVLSSIYLGTAEQVLTVAAIGTEGLIGYSFNGVLAGYMPFQDSIGDAHSFGVTAEGTRDMVRGTILEDATTARSTSGQSSAYQLGDIAAGEVGYAALHVIATTGSPTLDVDIQSDDSGAFGTPTVQGSFVQATAIGAEWIQIDPTITDDYWRADWTFGGTGSVTFLVNFGIN